MAATGAPAPTGWIEAIAAFNAWADLDAAARAAWLARLAAMDADMHARVVTLIRADQEAQEHSFLSPDVHPPAATFTGLEGRRLGPWLVERLIGSGGMGQVWLARRTDGLYDGRAAIKLMRLAASGDAGARFAREGRLLGRLSHPNIARLLDAGVTDSGERFLVLEYIEGERIDHWCDQRGLTVRQRLVLFLEVCKAVVHAHENLIVHRDLKPSNIFVAAGGTVKLLDFGVAKLIADESAESTELTREAGAALTPQYAAPEQLNGGAVSTATDVYGLGVVLFGLLSGSRPYASAPTSDAPSRPLWTLPSDGDAARRIAAERATSVKALRSELHGDLAVVVAKAIKPDPAERYRAVPDFADELQRVLDRRPIAARPDSLGYRTRRYVQRHAFGVGATALIALLLVAGASGTLIKQREATREAARAVAVKRFLLDLFEQARSSVNKAGVQSREATVNDMLVAGVDRVDKSLAAQPDVRDEVFQILVELVSDTGDRKQVVDLARARLVAARQAFGAEDVRSVPAEVMLAGVLLNFGETGDAAPMLAHAQALLDRAGDRTSIERARLLRWQGILDLETDVHPPWHDHPLRRATELLRARYADDDELLTALAVLPSVACRYGEGDEATSSAEELYTRTLKRHGDDNIYVDQANMQRGQLAFFGGHPAASISSLEQALAGLRRHVGEHSPDIVVAESELAESYLLGGRGEDSRRSFEAAEQTLARDHPGDKHLAAVMARTRDRLDKVRAGKPPGCGS